MPDLLSQLKLKKKNICFRSYLCTIGRLEMQVMQIFQLFFLSSFFFVYWDSDLQGSCLNVT